LDHLVRTLPFWRACYDGHAGAFASVIRDTQRGTKIMQARRAAGRWQSDTSSVHSSSRPDSSP
jgi:hypothetical protein